MLFALPQITIEHVALRADVAEDRRIAVMSFGSTAYSFFIAVGVIERGDVDIDRNIVSPVYLNSCDAGLFQQSAICLL